MIWICLLALFLFAVLAETILQHTSKTKPKNRDLGRSSGYGSTNRISRSSQRHRDAPLGASYSFDDDRDFNKSFDYGSGANTNDTSDFSGFGGGGSFGGGGASGSWDSDSSSDSSSDSGGDSGGDD